MRNIIQLAYELITGKRQKNKPGRQKTQDPRSVELPPGKKAEIIKQLEDLMKEQHPFLKPGYKIKYLAGELGIPSYQLSAFFNRHLGIRFNEYINRERIKYCEQLIHSGNAGNFNLRGLAMTCGFHNRNTFTVAFKRFTGHTPSNYIKQIKSSQDDSKGVEDLMDVNRPASQSLRLSS